MATSHPSASITGAATNVMQISCQKCKRKAKYIITIMTNIEMFQEHNIDCSRHQARESEPKDYNISTDPVRNLKRATYDRLASITDGVCILIHSPYRFYMFSQLEYQY